MSKVWTLLFIIISSNCLAEEFRHIKISNSLKTVIERKKNPTRSKTLLKSTDHALTNDYSVFLKSMLGDLISNTSDNPIPTEESPLYASVRNYLTEHHEQIGTTEVNQINTINRQFNLGIENFSGFSWQKPVGAITLYADRQLTPNLFGENWLIQDTFIFEINAATMLEKLADAGFVQMSSLEIGAFAGISFKRVYTTYHYAPSYQDGLISDFSKLFLPFLQFNLGKIEQLHQEEIIKREDFWTARAGGLISTPPYYGLTAGTAVLGEIAFNQLTSIQAGKESSNLSEERMRLSQQSTHSSKLQSTLTMQLDFFKLIKLTLMNFDLNYEYSKEVNQTLKFNQIQWSDIHQNQNFKNELSSIINGYSKIQLLTPYVSSLDNSSSRGTEFKGNILLLGKIEKSQTEQIKVINNGEIKLFYKYYGQSVKVIQNFFSQMFSAVIYKIFKFQPGVTNALLFKKKLSLEYEATSPQSADPKVNRVNSSQNFSFDIVHQLETGNTDKWYHSLVRRNTLNFLNQYTYFSEEITNLFRNNEIKGPLNLESIIRIDSWGFNFFIELPKNIVWKNVAIVCHSNKVNKWANGMIRKDMLKKLQIGKEACVKMIGQKYDSFISDYQNNSMSPSLTKFKDFIGSYLKESDSLVDIQNLFSSEHTFSQGRIQALTKEGNSFIQVFSAGQFRGLGVIDNFKRGNGSRAPATIISE